MQAGIIQFIPVDPVGLPGLAALMLGVVAFLIPLLRARSRGVMKPRSEDAGRRNASILWIVGQSFGIGRAGSGPMRIALAPSSPRALAEAVAVLAQMLAATCLFDASSRARGRNRVPVARARGGGTLVQSGRSRWCATRSMMPMRRA